MMSKQKSISKRTAIRHAFQRLMSGEDGTAGSALVEATIFVPILVAMAVYLADFGLIFYNKMEMQNGAQAGAQWAIANRIYNSSEVQVAALNATKLPACPVTGTSGVTVTSSEFCGCSDPNANPPVTQLASGACTGTTYVVNSTCNTTGVVGNYVTVTAAPATPTTCQATTYQPFVSFGLLSSTYNISATTTVRIQ